MSGSGETQIFFSEAVEKRRIPWFDYVKSVGMVGLCTVLAAPCSHYVQPRNLILIYVLGIIVISHRWSRGAALLSCFLSVFLYDLLYVPPAWELMPNDPEDLFTVFSMLLVALLIASMADLQRRSAQAALEREQAARTISQLTRVIAGTRTVAALADAAAAQVRNATGRRTVIVLCLRDTNVLEADSGLNQAELEKAGQALTSRATVFDDTNGTTFVPLQTANHSLGAMVIYATDKKRWSVTQASLMRAIADQITLGIERSTGLELAERAKLQVEGIKLRNALLSSVSHDLRTPLASIMGAASSILAHTPDELPPQQKELIQSIYDEADRLAKFLKNLLDMTRIESGAVTLKKEWQSIEESVGVALNRLKQQLAPFKVVTKLPDDLPLALYDEQLIDQVLFNLLDNAAKYAPAGSEITVTAKSSDEGVATAVSNTGCTLPPGGETKIFDKFYRGDAPTATYGAGLGLTICRGIMQAHGGQMWAERFGDGGISIWFLLPKQGEPPTVETEELENVT